MTSVDQADAARERARLAGVRQQTAVDAATAERFRQAMARELPVDAPVPPEARDPLDRPELAVEPDKSDEKPDAMPNAMPNAKPAAKTEETAVSSDLLDSGRPVVQEAEVESPAAPALPLPPNDDRPSERAAPREDDHDTADAPGASRAGRRRKADESDGTSGTAGMPGAFGLFGGFSEDMAAGAGAGGGGSSNSSGQSGAGGDPGASGMAGARGASAADAATAAQALARARGVIDAVASRIEATSGVPGAITVQVRPEVMPGVSFQLSQTEGRWQVDLDVSDPASAATLTAAGEQMASTLSRRLGRGVDVSVRATAAVDRFARPATDGRVDGPTPAPRRFSGEADPNHSGDSDVAMASPDALRR